MHYYEEFRFQRPAKCFHFATIFFLVASLGLAQATANETECVCGRGQRAATQKRRCVFHGMLVSGNSTVRQKGVNITGFNCPRREKERGNSVWGS